MVDQRRSQASAKQPKYETYAKPVLLSQPEKQRSDSLLSSSKEPDPVTNLGGRKITPGKLDLTKVRGLQQGELRTSPGSASAPAQRSATKMREDAPNTDGGNTGKENLLSPGRLDLPNGTPLSRHPSDALSNRTSPKTLPNADGMAQGQITIAVAQYEQKILQGQRRRKGRFSGASTPDVSRHASVCSSEHVTPREPPVRPTPEPRSNGTSAVSDSALDSRAAEAERGSLPKGQVTQHVPEELPERGSEDSSRQGSAVAAETEAVADLSAAASSGPSSGGVGKAAASETDQARSSSAMQQPPATQQHDKDDSPTAAFAPSASAADSSERGEIGDPALFKQQAETVTLPVSTRASTAAELEPEHRSHKAADSPGQLAGPAAAAPAVAAAGNSPVSGWETGSPDQAASSSLRGEGTPAEASAQERPEPGWRLSAESAREPEWVAAFRRTVSLAVNTPLLQSPAARSAPSANAARMSNGTGSLPELAPSPSSEVGGTEDGRSGGAFSRGGGRNLDTAFESALTDCRRKRMRADEGAHGSGSVVRAAAAVQRAAERAALDRNDYSGARISAEAASVLSPGAIALVNGRSMHSSAALQAQLSDVVHQLRFCLASMSEQQRPLLHATDILQADKVPRRELSEAAEKLQEAERLRRWSEIAQSESIARLLGILAEMQAAQRARAEEVHFSAPVWLQLLGSSPAQNDSGCLRQC